jgi:hypothetical protein
METMTRTRPLPDIDAIPRPLNEADKACFADIRVVLANHGMLDRFGVTLLHEHFPVADDEVLFETCDPAARRLTMEVIKVSPDVQANSVETTWRLDSLATMMTCRTRCPLHPVTRDHAGQVHDYNR